VDRLGLGIIRSHRDPYLPMAGGGGLAERTLRSVLAIHVDRPVARVFGLWLRVIVTWAREPADDTNSASDHGSHCHACPRGGTYCRSSSQMTRAPGGSALSGLPRESEIFSATFL